MSDPLFHVQAADARLRVRRIETDRMEKDRPVLVYLHEGLGNIELWRDFPDRLCQTTGLSGIVYERRGYGGSAPLPVWPMEYLDAEANVYLPALLDACGIEAAILIGHSDGGTISLLAAAGGDQRIQGIVTEAAHIFVEETTLAGIREAVEAYENGDLKPKLARYHGERTETVFRRWADRWLSPEFRDWNITGCLPDITVPALVLQGVDDPYATTAQVTGIASGVSGTVRTELMPDCGHIPHMAAREKTLALMQRWINTIIP